jgi:hypothetical protein
MENGSAVLPMVAVGASLPIGLEASPAAADEGGWIDTADEQPLDDMGRLLAMCDVAPSDNPRAPVSPDALLDAAREQMAGVHKHGCAAPTAAVRRLLPCLLWGGTLYRGRPTFFRSKRRINVRHQLWCRVGGTWRGTQVRYERVCETAMCVNPLHVMPVPRSDHHKTVRLVAAQRQRMKRALKWMLRTAADVSEGRLEHEIAEAIDNLTTERPMPNG